MRSRYALALGVAGALALVLFAARALPEDEVVDVVNGIAVLSFWLFLVVGTVSVLARYTFYRTRGFRLPRLLTRDVVFMGGFALSFGLVLFARVLPEEVATSLDLRHSLPWALATAIPAVTAVGVFAYFELFVIEKGDAGRAELRDRRGREALEQDDETLPERVPKV